MDKELGFTRSKPRFTGKVRLCIARYRYANKITEDVFIVCGNRLNIEAVKKKPKNFQTSKNVKRQDLHYPFIEILLSF